MKSVEDFVIWSITNGFHKVQDVKNKLSTYGFNEQEINNSIYKLFEENKIQLFRNGMISIIK